MFAKHKWKLIGLKKEPKRYRCAYCQASFPKSGGLSKHHSMKHPGLQWTGPRQRTPSKSPSTPFAFSTSVSTPERIRIASKKLVAKKIQKKKTKPRKVYVTLQNQDRARYAKELAETPRGKKKAFAADRGLSRRSLYRWNSSSALKETWKSRKASRARYCMNPNDKRRLGKFHPQQRKVYNLYRYRRSQGDPCDSDWFRSEMTRICNDDKPDGYDPNKDKFTDMWKRGFCKRWKISVQKKTNNKAKSVYERIHRVSNYHYYSIYKAATEPLKK